MRKNIASNSLQCGKHYKEDYATQPTGLNNAITIVGNLDSIKMDRALDYTAGMSYKMEAEGREEEVPKKAMGKPERIISREVKNLSEYVLLVSFWEEYSYYSLLWTRFCCKLGSLYIDSN